MTTSQIKRVEQGRQEALNNINREMKKAEHLRDYASISRNSAHVEKMNQMLKDGWNVA